MLKYFDYHFNGQRKGEEILLVSHRHWFNIAIQFAYVFGIVAFIVLIYSVAPYVFPESEQNTLILNFFVSFFFMLFWIFSATVWIDYYLDVWIITDQRIVNIEQKGLFSRQVSELEHIRVQDVTTDVRGFIPTFMNYGDVFIQTAAEKERFTFRSVPNPYKIKTLIMRLQKAQAKEETNELGEMIQKRIRGEIA